MTAESYHDYDAPDAGASHAPPHNIEAEQALLGALLFDNEVYYRVGDWLKAEHFYDPLHARIYETASRLIISGSLADAVVLKSQFERDAGMQEIGGVVYLADLMREAPDPASATEYARLVYDLALRRELIRFGGDLTQAATEPGETPATGLLEDAERSLFALAETGSARRTLQPFHVALQESMSMALAAYNRGGGLSGISSGLKSLDKKLGGMHRSDLIILAGRPSMGKSSLALNIAFSMARAYEAEETPDGQRKTKNGGVVAFFSLEMSSEQLATRLISDYTGISGFLIRQGKIDATQFEEIRDAVGEISDTPLYIDDTGGLPIGALTARARRLKRRVGLDCVIVDYLQLVTGSNTRSDNRVQEVSEVTQALKALAKELNVPVIALSQLSRQVEQRDDKKPQLSDLRESGSIEQDADVVMFVYRESYYLERAEPKENTDQHLAWEDEMRLVRNQADVIIAKQRHGPIGSVKVHFDPDRTKFSDLDDGHHGDPN